MTLEIVINKSLVVTKSACFMDVFMSVFMVSRLLAKPEGNVSALCTHHQLIKK